ncbi:hypothetical protein BGZ60DRAFT_424983, partial [Tricladium varicosporioides]
MSTIQILSDLHLETPKSYDVFEIIPTSPYLALLGDIGCVKDEEYFIFLEQLLSNYKIVFLLLGNHEPYHSDWTNAKQKIRKFEQEVRENKASQNLASFVFLDQTRFDLSPKLTILGCTLFSKILPSQMNDVSFGLNDFYHIQDWTVEQHNEAFAADLAWLNSEVTLIMDNEPERRVIILTHYSPSISPAVVDPVHSQSRISSGFASDLSGELCWTSGNVVVWAFGHTHFNCDFVEEGSGKRVVTNQRGYYFQQAVRFDGEKRVEG